MKQKVKVSFDIEIDYPTIEQNKQVEKRVKQWAKAWILGTEWSDFVPMFFDDAMEDEEYPYYTAAKFNVQAKYNDKLFVNEKWTENGEEIIEGATQFIPLKRVKKTTPKQISKK